MMMKVNLTQISQIRDLNNELSVLKNNYIDLEKLYEDL